MRITCTAFSATPLPDGRLHVELEGAVVAPSRAPLSKRDLAERLGYSVSWIDKRLAEGMPFMRLGSHPKFDEKSVVAWLERRSIRRRLHKPR